MRREVYVFMSKIFPWKAYPFPTNPDLGLGLLLLPCYKSIFVNCPLVWKRDLVSHIFAMWLAVHYAVIAKTYLYNFDPLKPHFYIVKLGFTGVYIIFLISARNKDCGLDLLELPRLDCGYSLELPWRGGSNKYTQSIFEQKYENYQNFLSENLHFLVLKFSVYLNRRVFVMSYRVLCWIN